MAWVVGISAWVAGFIVSFAGAQDALLIGVFCLAGTATVVAIAVRSGRVHPTPPPQSAADRWKRASVGLLKVMVAVVLNALILMLLWSLLRQSMFGCVAVSVLRSMGKAG